MKRLESVRTALMRSSPRFVWSTTILGLGILLSFFVAIGYDFYRGTLQINEQAAENIAALTEQDVARNIELFDLSLQAVLESVNDPETMAQEPRLRQKIIFDRSATARGLGALVVLDETGSIILDSKGEMPRHGNFADREYFKIHRDSPTDVGLYVSNPFKARLQEGIWSISVSRRISRPDGSFAGIVSGTMKLEYFQQLFRRVALGDGSVISLFKDDGTLMVRNVLNDDKIGANWRTASVFDHMDGRVHGAFVSDRSMDGVPRLYAFHRVAELPLFIVVGQSKSQVLAPWWSKVRILAGIFIVMAASVLMLVWMLDAELGRRAAAEIAAAELARTDGLTKLANRRSFEEALNDEWARATRDARPISLLMIDADYFKRFNDTYGHQAGDHALRAIADVIARTIRRPGDLAARYGGEEFAVLLPNTDNHGASRLAVAIQENVRGLGIAHDESEYKVVTASAGVATAMPRVGTTAGSLVHDADTALYRAKDQGRNAVCVSNVVRPVLARSSTGS